jgi:superfamily II DNA/RNA helicase
MWQDRMIVCIFVMQDAVIIGGLEMQAQAKALAKRPHIVVATPGRLRVCDSPWPPCLTETLLDLLGQVLNAVHLLS